LLVLVLTAQVQTAPSTYPLRILDPAGLLEGEVTVILVGDQGSRKFVAKPETGSQGSAHATPIYATSMEPVGSTMTIRVINAGNSWVGTLPALKGLDEPEAYVKVLPTGVVELVERSTVSRPLPVEVVPRRASDAKPGPGLWLWGVLFLGLGVGGGIGLVVLGRRPRGDCRLDTAAEAPTPPRRLAAADLTSAVRGPLANHRLVVLGELEEPLPHVIPCRDRAPLPQELVRAVERLAVVPGPSVGLLLTRPDLLDEAGPGDPLERLAAEIDGRFPLWVVDGPDRWPRLQLTDGTGETEHR